MGYLRRGGLRAAVLPDLRILATARGGLGDAGRPLGLGNGDRGEDLVGCTFLGHASAQQQLEQHGTFELLERVGHLVARPLGRVPFRDDPPRMRDTMGAATQEALERLPSSRS